MGEKEKVVKKEKPPHLWWRRIVWFVIGFSMPGVLVFAGTVYATTQIEHSQVIKMFGGNPDDFLAKDLQDLSLTDTVFHFINSDYKFETIADIEQITPVVSTLLDTLNVTLTDAIGCTMNMENIKNSTWSNLGNTLFSEIKQGVKLGRLLNIDSSSMPILQYIAYPKVEVGGVLQYDFDNPRNLDDLINNMSTIIGDLRLSDALEMHEGDALWGLRDIKVMQFGSEIQNVKVGDIVPVDSDSAKILKYLADKKIGEVGDCIGTMKLGDVFEINEDSPMVLKALQNSTLSSIAQDTNNLKLGQVIEIGTDSPLILKTLQNETILSLPDKINTLKIGEIVEINSSSSPILQRLANSTIATIDEDLGQITVGDVFSNEQLAENRFLTFISPDTVITNIGSAISDLKFSEVFADEIFDPVTGEITPTWKFLLYKKEGSTWNYVGADYKIGSTDDIKSLTDNMKHNIGTATIKEMYDAGILTGISTEFMNKQVYFGGSLVYLRDLTITEVLNYLGTI